MHIDVGSDRTVDKKLAQGKHVARRRALASSPRQRAGLIHIHSAVIGHL